MVKVKNKKNFGQADKLHAKKSIAKQKKVLNPFEVHINKEKFKVIGKRSKNDWGLPGVSRAKAMKKRKNTLGHELKLVNKTNTFLDKRIGEKNSGLTEEDKMMARFAAERIQQHKTGKQSIYNLAEEEILTHQGQTLEEIEKFDDPRSDDDDDEERESKKYGHLRENFVADANFGGGVLSRNENKDGALSRKDLIEQLIIESKKRKMEKQKLKEETLDLTEKLDTDWKDLQPVVAKNFNREIEKNEKSRAEPVSIIDKLLNAYDKKNADYDKTMRELKFEPRGKPSDRLKSEDEIAKIEKDKLESLEQDRLARMHGVAELDKVKEKPKHRSADDLDDDYEVDSEPEVMVAYDSEGKALNQEQFKLSKDDDSEGDDSKSEDEGNEDEDEGNDDEYEQNGEEQQDEGEEEESDSGDSLDDLRVPDKASSSEDEEDEGVPKLIPCRKNYVSLLEESDTDKKAKKRKADQEISAVSTKTKKDAKVSVDESSVENAANDMKANLLAKKAMMEKAAAELPYTYKMPESYEALQELLEAQPPDYQHIIVERIIKCNHPKLGEENKEKLATLFAYLLQYLNDLFSEESLIAEKDIINSFKCFDRLTCHFYDIAQMDPTNAKNCILEVIKEKFDDYKKKTKVYPGLETLIFFKLISLLFPTSDLKHPVVTPAFIFMSNILTSSTIKSSSDIAKGLFISTLVLEYTMLSKRILPAVINFLQGILFLAVPTSSESKTRVLKPFSNSEPYSNLLVLQEKQKTQWDSKKCLMLAKYLIDETQDDEFKVRALVTAANLSHEIFKQCEDLAAQRALFEPHLKLLDQIKHNHYPQFVKELLDSVKTSMSNAFKNKVLQPLIAEKKPKTLKLYEPEIENSFSGKKRKSLTKERAEHEKLIYRHKKEMKGALREIRRDKSFIGSVKIKDKIRSDNIRKEKVKQIYSEASIQQGELNALQRSKKKKK